MANEKSDEEILIEAKNRDADTLLASYSEADEALILKRALARQAERNAKASAADPDEAFWKRLSRMSDGEFNHRNSWGKWDDLGNG